MAAAVMSSAGSTAGGIKVIRWLLVYKQGVREIVRLVHPSAEIPVKLGNKAVPYRVVDAVWGFFSIYVIVFAAMMLAMMATGLDQVTAFSAVAATLNNLGPGLGEVAKGFMSVSDLGKWIAIVGMLLGRLTECVPAHRMQDIIALGFPVARDHVAHRIIAHMAHMQTATGIGEHGQAVEFFPVRVFHCLETGVIFPELLGGVLYLFWVVLRIHG